MTNDIKLVVFCLGLIEDIAAKGENTDFQYFLHLEQHFQKPLPRIV